MKQNRGMWRYLIFGPTQEESEVYKDFEMELPNRREYVGVAWWNWRKRTWDKVIRATVCRVRGHDMREIESSDTMWYGGQGCGRCNKIDYYKEDGTIWEPA